MTRALIAAIALVACAPQRPEQSLPSSVRVRVTNPAGVAEPASLRYAIVWVTKQAGRNAFVATDDGPVASTTATFTAELSLPEDRVRKSVYPVEPLGVTALSVVDAYRPRIVVYGDTNENGRFDPGVLGGTGPDTILGVDNERAALPTAILDLDGALRGMTLAESQAFYQRSGGVYSAFVWSEETGYGLSLAGPSDAFVILPESNAAERDLDCTRSLVRNVSSPLPSGTARPPTHALVDVALDPTAVCGTDIVNCESTDFATLSPSSFDEDETGDRQRLLQCRANDSLEFFSIFERSVECDGCLCQTKQHADLYVTTPATLPPWWPCGTTVPYCKSDVPATDFDFACRVEPRDAGVDGGVDASTGDGR
jgi:hypothetical protein